MGRAVGAVSARDPGIDLLLSQGMLYDGPCILRDLPSGTP